MSRYLPNWIDKLETEFRRFFTISIKVTGLLKKTLAILSAILNIKLKKQIIYNDQIQSMPSKGVIRTFS